MKLKEFPVAAYNICTDESIKFTAIQQAYYAVVQLADQFGRYNRHMQRVEVERIANLIVDDAERFIKEHKEEK
jgi:hypothetical protein